MATAIRYLSMAICREKQDVLIEHPFFVLHHACSPGSGYHPIQFRL